MNQIPSSIFKSAVPKLSSTAWRCSVCDSVGAFESYNVREHMFGYGDTFEYRRCIDCGCLQILNTPVDLSRYYGSGYYSMGERPRRGWLATMLIRARNRHLAGHFDPLGGCLARRWRFLALASLRPLKLNRNARILDVGCGGGELLLALQSAGFTRLLGVDPFVVADMDLGGGLIVKRVELTDLVLQLGESSAFDLVMFHHSLEHIENPVATLRAAYAALVPGGRCVVRIPTVDSYAWRYYGVDWCALDAPRHLMLHSRRSIALLAKKCGFEVDASIDDSTAFQFWGSEQYRRGVSLMRPGCHDILPATGLFTAEELRSFEQRAVEMNRQGDGDQIVVYLRRAAS